ncbi:C6 transcription factor [Diaporthe sp. PMI_573]|nr:C6 transcription factor [Diaporthaceae sp. PMI_573]
MPQLSCELCRERKVRCDKATPHCTTCVKAGIACVPVYRKRYSRGRHTARRNVGRPAKGTAPAVGSVPQQEEDDLPDRVRRLECLISDINPERRDANVLFRDTWASQTPESLLLSGLDPTPPQHGRGNVNTNTGNESRPGRDVKREFWRDLVKEMHGYRDGLAPDVTDEETAVVTPFTATSTPSPLSSRADSVLGLGYMTAHPSQRYTTSPALVAQLCHVFDRQVDPIIKIMHRPTLNAYLVECKGFLDYDLCDPRPAALRAAVCYAAVASMTEEQCQATFSCPKLKVLPEYRDACDVALNKAGLLTSMEMTVLQAFVLYLVARRAEDPSLAVWTLIAVAVRMAKGLSLHLEQPIISGSFFQRQMSNRLWCSICALDLQASLHEASEPLIDLEEEHYTLPRNINDADFDMTFQGADIPDKDELTDMTFSLMIYKAQLGGRFLNFRDMTTSTTNKSSSGHTAKLQKDRLSQARRFEDQVRPLMATCDPESNAYAWFTFHHADSIVSSMRLSAFRPLRRTGERAVPCFQGDNEALASALNMLSKAQLVRSDPRGEGFRWYVRIQWHTLAIAIVECFVCPDKQLLASAWPVVEAAYDSTYALQNHQQVGDEAPAADIDRQDGAPRQLLQALMMRTRAKVKKLLRGAAGRGVVMAPVVGTARRGWSSSGSRTPADPFALQSPSVISLPEIEQDAADTLVLPSPLDFGFGLGPIPALTPSSSSPDRGDGASTSLGQGLGEAWSLMPACSSSMADTNVNDGVDLGVMLDLSWQNWEDILSGFDQKGGFP